MISTGRLGLLASLLAAWALIDPRLAAIGPWAALVCFGALVRLASGGLHFRLLPPLVGIFAGVIAATGYNLEADTVSYMANAASLIQDRDLDVGNQRVAWGFPSSSRGPAGMTITPHPVGNAFVWALPVLLGHVYALLVRVYPTNFFSPPYFGVVILVNLVVALSGALALARTLARPFGETTAALAVLAAMLASPTVYYLAVQAVMVHGLTFGLAAWAIWAVDRAVTQDTAASWRWAGGVLGVACACRFQAIILIALVPLLSGMQPRILVRRFLHVAGPMAVALVPQAVVWFKTFGRLFAIPQGDGFMHWASPHWADTLFSADRGLFNWHPLLFLGLVGLLLIGPAFRRLALSGLTVFVFSVWINGAVDDFNGGDAFGARRYDLVIPFFAVGFARLLHQLRPVLVRSPLLLPSALVAAVTLWNFSFIGYYRAKDFQAAAPLEELASAQARRVQRVTETAFGVLGPGAKFRIYDAFVGLFTYRNYRPGGDFDVATLEPRYLREGWSAPRTWGDWPLFRYVLYPKACLVVPLAEPFEMHGALVARSPARIEGQTVRISLNGHLLTDAPLPAEWTDVPFVAPERLWVAGENLFCFEFSKKRPGDKGDDLAYVAAVVRLQLP